MSTSLYPARTPETVWAAQEAATNWWVVEAWPSGPALLMSVCPEQIAGALQKQMAAAGRPPSLWREWYTLRLLGWQEACQLAASLIDPSGKPIVPTLLITPVSAILETIDPETIDPERSRP